MIPPGMSWRPKARSVPAPREATAPEAPRGVAPDPSPTLTEPPARRNDPAARVIPSFGGASTRRRFRPQGVAGTRVDTTRPRYLTRRRNRHVARRRRRLGPRHSRRPATQPSQTLADLVAAAAHAGRGTLGAIGRCLRASTTAKHRIEQAWRFRANDRVRAPDVMPRVIRRLSRPTNSSMRPSGRPWRLWETGDDSGFVRLVGGRARGRIGCGHDGRFPEPVVAGTARGAHNVPGHFRECRVSNAGGGRGEKCEKCPGNQAKCTHSSTG
jgi:hypothetical protein